ncbi:MAG: hypothetical protein ACE5DQ_02365, partial [Candidatus Paceibacterota bacterium]
MQSFRRFLYRLSARLTSFLFFLLGSTVYAQGGGPTFDPDVQIAPGALGFEIPTFGEILTFLVRFFFVIAGLAALFYLLWGAISWVTSGGVSPG